jgi:hypothetical protein
MSDTTERLASVNASDRPQAFALLGEAVWCITIVDATLVRYHAETYDAVMADQTPAERRLIEGTLAGLRFVRNRIGHEVDLAEFIESGAHGPGAGEERVTGWAWMSVPNWRSRRFCRARGRGDDAVSGVPDQLAGRTIGERFERVAAFLELTAANAPDHRYQYACRT